jgi:hypothetical protein
MRFGIREICDVVLKAKTSVKIGNTTFAEGQPVIYFDSLKTSTMEGAATTVYAQGGRGNSRLVAWEGERTVTFTMEDALISEMGIAVLTGAGLITADTNNTVYVHTTSQHQLDESTKSVTVNFDEDINATQKAWGLILDAKGNVIETIAITPSNNSLTAAATDATKDKAKAVIFDFYVERKTGAFQIEITPDKFAGNYYLEASTLFRDTDGKDHPAEFIIPNCKIQSNFTFTMASSGDPSTFTFTMDAFPDYTKFDYSKKVLSVIQVIEDETDGILADKATS